MACTVLHGHFDHLNVWNSMNIHVHVCINFEQFLCLKLIIKFMLLLTSKSCAWNSWSAFHYIGLYLSLEKFENGKIALWTCSFVCIFFNILYCFIFFKLFFLLYIQCIVVVLKHCSAQHCSKGIRLSLFWNPQNTYF